MIVYTLTPGSCAPEEYRHRVFVYDNLADARADLMAWGREYYGEAELEQHLYHLGDAIERVGEIDPVEWVGGRLPLEGN